MNLTKILYGKKKSKKSFTKKKPIFNVTIFAVFILCSLFISCENFLNGSLLKEKLEEEIEYANAPECKILIKADSKTGSFLVEGEKLVKVGYSFDVQFTVNSGWIFKELIAVSANDKTESRNEYVQIKETGRNEEFNTYIFSVTVLKPVSDIYLTADCALSPDGIFFPDMILSGVPQDTNIKIIFNTPVGMDYFYDPEKNLFKNIEITSGSTNWIPEDNNFYYFAAPELSEDGCILLIPTNKNNLILKDMDTTKDINVVLHTKGLISETGLEFKNDLEWTYRINSSLDKEKPTEAAVTIFSGENSAGNINPLTFNDDWDDSLFLQNHVGKNIFIKAAAFDAGGGVNSVYIKETLIRNKEGDNVENLNKYRTYLLTNLSFTTPADNFYSTEFVHELLIDEDGIIKVEISLVDYAGNQSVPECFYVVKDTKLESTDITPKEEEHCILDNVFSDKFYYGNSNNDFCLRYSTIDSSFIREANGITDIYNLDFSDMQEEFYNGHKSSVKVYEVLYGYSSSEEDMIQAQADTTGNIYTIKRDKTYNTYVLIKACDEAGNIATILRIIPHNVEPRDIKIPLLQKNYVATSVIVSDFSDFQNYGEEANVYCVLKNLDGEYCVFPDILSNEASPTKLEVSFNPYSRYYYNSNGSAQNFRDLDCHTGPANQKVLATQEDYEEFMPSGNYEVFIIPYIRYAEKTYFGNRSNPFIITLKNDGIKRSYTPFNSKESYSVPFNTYETKKESINAENVFPQKEDVEFFLAPGEKNSGRYIAKVDFNSENSYFTYSLMAQDYLANGNVNTTSYSSTNWIYLLSERDYKIYLQASDPNGNHYTSSYYFDAACYGFDVTSPKFVFDNLPSTTPAILTQSSFYTLPSGFRLFNVNGHSQSSMIPYDENGLMTDEDGNAFIEYYFIYLGDKKEARDYSDAELAAYEKKILYFCPDDVYADGILDSNLKYLLPYDGLREGYYELLMKVYDNSGNSKNTYGVISTSIVERPFTYENNGTSFKAKSSASISRNFVEILDENGMWQEVLKTTYKNSKGYAYNYYVGDYQGYLHESNAFSSSGIELSKLNEGKSFIRLNTNNSGICSYTKYVLPDYYNASSSVDYSCNLKNIVMSSSTTPVLSIMCDAPALAHTFCCSSNLSELANPDDDNEHIAEIWSSKGIEVCDKGTIVQKASSFSYKIPIKSETIAKGMWYTTIVHFADGSTLMTEPKQK